MNMMNIGLGITILGVNVVLILLMKMTRANKERALNAAQIRELKPLNYTWHYIGIIIGAVAIGIGIL